MDVEATHWLFFPEELANGVPPLHGLPGYQTTLAWETPANTWSLSGTFPRSILFLGTDRLISFT